MVKGGPTPKPTRGLNLVSNKKNNFLLPFYLDGSKKDSLTHMHSILFNHMMCVCTSVVDTNIICLHRSV